MSADLRRDTAPPAGRRAGRRLTPAGVLLLLGLLALVSAVCFMTVGATGSWSFVLPFRAGKLAAMVVVAYAIAVSTVLFQTITGNRILTPAIMGFDSLYVLLQTCMVFFLGSTVTARLDPHLRFGVEVGLLVVFAVTLFRWLFTGATRSLHLLLLVGVVFGVLFRSLSNFLQRMIDPNEFAVLQDRFFASFNSIDTTLLGMSAAIIAVVSVLGLRYARGLDVLLLGREPAIALGVDHARVVSVLLVIVAVLVSVSTALVGPVTFFGLLVANLAYLVVGTHRHSVVLPAAVLIAVICLVGGQTVLERVFSFDTSLSIIIEFVGGIVFIGLLLRGSAR